MAARRERPYLPDPADGYPLAVDGRRLEALLAAHRALLRGEVAAARSTAQELLATDPRLHPAVVLAAEADLLSGRLQAAAERLAPVTAELPLYTAAQLVAGRVAERQSDLPRAYAAYHAVADLSAQAAERAGELLPRTLEVLGNRVADALRRNRLAEAEGDLARMQAWGEGATVTLEATAEVAAARGDAQAQLVAVRQLALRSPDDRALAERRAELELAAGDPAIGLEIVQRLVEENPRDSALAEKLEIAKFRWRLSMLPEEVQAIAAVPELTRADFATLLYWMIPDVRYGHADRPRIASDILDHPHQEEVVRVVNQGLLEVDAVRHRFEPDRPVVRGEVLKALLTVLADSSPRPACLGSFEPGPVATAAVCAAAARCALLPEVAACLAGAEVAGGEAVELIRRTLEQK